MNYGELIVNIPLWSMAANEELRRAMPQIVRRAERRLHNELHADAFRATATGTLTANSPVLDLSLYQPIDVASITVTVDGQTCSLDPRSLEFLEALFQDASRSDVPRFYGEATPRFFYRLFPTPDQDYPWTARLALAPPLLSPDVIENTMTQDYPNVVEAACMVETALFMRSEQLSASWQPRYERELLAANARIARGRRDETTVRPRETANQAGR